MSSPFTIDTFLVQARDKRAHHAAVILSPFTARPSAKIRLMVITELPATRRLEQAENVRQFASEFFERYFAAARDDGDPDAHFETALEWANTELPVALDLKKDSAVPAMIIGCVTDAHLLFSIAGEPSAFIFYKEGHALRALDLIKTYGAESAKTSSAPFYTLISGELKTDNCVILSTAPLSDFIAPEKLHALISRESAPADTLSKQLNTLAPHRSFGGVLIYAPLERGTAMRRAADTSPTASIKKLMRQEQMTARVLFPSFLHDLFKKTAGALMGRISGSSASDAENTRASRSAYGASAASKTRLIGNTAQNMLVTLGFYLVSLFQYAVRVAKGDTETRRALLKRPFAMCYARMQRVRGAWNARPRVQQISIIVCLIAAFFIASAALISSASKKERLAQEQYTMLYNTIKDKMDATESMIIYNDFKNANLQVRALQALLEGFPDDTQNHKDTKSAFQQSLNDLIVRLQRMTRIEPELVADLSSQNPPPLTKLIRSGDAIWALCDGTRAFTVNARTKEIKYMDSPLLGKVSAEALKSDGEYVLAVGNGRLVDAHLQTSALASLDVAWSAPSPSISAIGIYNGRLYAVDSGENMITKHTASATGFGRGTNWLSAPDTHLNAASALAIDGALYVGLKNGDLYIYENSKVKKAALDLLDPHLKTITALYTAKGSPYLFILDAASQRVIIWDKKGVLKTQFTAPEFDALKDFSVDEKNKEITVLSGTKIFKFNYTN